MLLPIRSNTHSETFFPHAHNTDFLAGIIIRPFSFTPTAPYTLPQHSTMLTLLRRRYPLTGRLETHITSYSVHLIVALITLPSLIWHISDTHIHDDYNMPDDWVKSFDKTQFTGGRGWLWGFLFVVVCFSDARESCLSRNNDPDTRRRSRSIACSHFWR